MEEAIMIIEIILVSYHKLKVPVKQLYKLTKFLNLETVSPKFKTFRSMRNINRQYVALLREITLEFSEIVEQSEGLNFGIQNASQLYQNGGQQSQREMRVKLDELHVLITELVHDIPKLRERTADISQICSNLEEIVRQLLGQLESYQQMVCNLILNEGHFVMIGLAKINNVEIQPPKVSFSEEVRKALMALND